jgi:protein-S-isoprenylcysteine O-methyltransferase Ste14
MRAHWRQIWQRAIDLRRSVTCGMADRRHGRVRPCGAVLDLAQPGAFAESEGTLDINRPRPPDLGRDRLGHARPRAPAPLISAAEQTRAARVGAWLFRYRSFLPVPVVIIGLLVPGDQGLFTWIVGGLLIALGEAFRLAGVAAAGTVTRRRSRNVRELVNWGVFALSRNPLYVGNFFIWIGFAEMSGVQWFPVVAAALFVAEYHFIVAYEEGVLESTFGEEYLAYKAKVPRWLPRVGARATRGELHWAEAWKSERSTFMQYAALVVLLIVKARWRF